MSGVIVVHGIAAAFRPSDNPLLPSRTVLLNPLARNYGRSVAPPRSFSTPEKYIASVLGSRVYRFPLHDTSSSLILAKSMCSAVGIPSLVSVQRTHAWP